MRVPSVGREDSLETEMVICFSIITWEIPWTEEPGRLQFMGSQKGQTGLKRRSTAQLSQCQSSLWVEFQGEFAFAIL